MIKRIICKITGHDFSIDAGSCPFTGNSYVICKKCLRMKVKNEKMKFLMFCLASLKLVVGEIIQQF